ncbi:hypothetical protein GLOTRDRAFT_109424, partial [Gloeophyllum trabeum ATCC 11539]
MICGKSCLASIRRADRGLATSLAACSMQEVLRARLRDKRAGASRIIGPYRDLQTETTPASCNGLTLTLARTPSRRRMGCCSSPVHIFPRATAVWTLCRLSLGSVIAFSLLVCHLCPVSYHRAYKQYRLFYSSLFSHWRPPAPSSSTTGTAAYRRLRVVSRLFGSLPIGQQHPVLHGITVVEWLIAGELDASHPRRALA